MSPYENHLRDGDRNWKNAQFNVSPLPQNTRYLGADVRCKQGAQDFQLPNCVASCNLRGFEPIQHTERREKADTSVFGRTIIKLNTSNVLPPEGVDFTGGV